MKAMKGRPSKQLLRWILIVEGQTSGDGITFTGSKDESFGAVTYIQNWGLHATE